MGLTQASNAILKPIFIYLGNRFCILFVLLNLGENLCQAHLF
jgi:hypothetical protein